MTTRKGQHVARERMGRSQKALWLSLPFPGFNRAKQQGSLCQQGAFPPTRQRIAIQGKDVEVVG